MKKLTKKAKIFFYKNTNFINNKNASGITLITLVITIIVLLILAGITIATITGNNGILDNANKASEQTEISNEKEILELSTVKAIAEDKSGNITRTNLNKELENYIGIEGTDYTLTESETAPFIVTYLDSERSYLVDKNGDISEYIDVSKYVSVGDFVDYKPTIADKNGTPVEADKLTYTSTKGSATEHGNGFSNYTFTAKNIEWQVLNIKDGKVQLIPKNNTISPQLIIRGTIGYLYAEQELHEICKIYGYGYGADTSQITQYSYGGPLDGNLMGEIKGSGARSITIDDINKAVGIYEDENNILRFSDGGIVDSSYGSSTNPTINIHYPTIMTSTGRSTLAGVKNLKNTYYSYSKSILEDTNLQNMLFNGNYWLASRCIKTSSNESDFCVYTISPNALSKLVICTGSPSALTDVSFTGIQVYPVVTLKINSIDTNTDYETEGHWNLK